MLHFPPVYDMLGICISSENEKMAIEVSDRIAEALKEYRKSDGLKGSLDCIGPAEAYIYRMNNIYRRVIYLKSDVYENLTESVKMADNIVTSMELPAGLVDVQYDFNPMRII